MSPRFLPTLPSTREMDMILHKSKGEGLPFVAGIALLISELVFWGSYFPVEEFQSVTKQMFFVIHFILVKRQQRNVQ